MACLSPKHQWQIHIHKQCAAGDVAQVCQRPVAGPGEVSPHVQVAPGHRQRMNIIVQALVGHCMPGTGSGIVAGDAAQVHLTVASLGEVSPNVQVAPGHRQRDNPIAQALVGQRVPCAGGGIVAGDVAQVSQRPVAGSGKVSPHVQVVPGHRQHGNPKTQALVGQRVPCAGGGIVAGDVTQVRQRPIAGLGKASPHVQVVPRHRQRKNIIVQSLIG
ncbi:MAG: hypothetical protein WBB55_09155 [Anaerolineales bacterium]